MDKNVVLVVSDHSEFWSYVSTLPSPHSGTPDRVIDARGVSHILVSQPKDFLGYHGVRVIFHGTMAKKRDFWQEMFHFASLVGRDDAGSYSAKEVTD